VSDGTVRLGVRTVGELQERAARAVPASVLELRDGAWLRYVERTATWWAGAILLHGAAARDDLAGSIDAAERFAATHGAPATFQVCPACPARLDDALTARGYRRGPEVSLQTVTSAAVGRPVEAPGVRVALAEVPSADWFHVLLGDLPPETAQAERRLIARVALPAAYATGWLDGRAVAVGRAVADTGWAGVFSMVTRPDARRRGAASALVSALAGWADRRGCRQLYLQVTRDSEAALAVYARAGFAEAARYHYRVAGSG
jgi:N-acetylglutamate synthase